jgi:glycosyltransferase involved in cell wall biosynthesis
LRGQIADVQLVLAGPVDARRTQLFANESGVLLLGHLDRETLLGLMTSATAVVVPSLYEGFGFPAVEAMASRTAVVATREGSLPEICGDAALLCDADPEALAHSLGEVLQDNQLRTALVEAGRPRARMFTWESAAEGYLAVYRMCLDLPLE